MAVESKVNRQATCSAPVNIAVIKYWGKRDEKLILPTNSSLSATLDQADLKTTTSVALSSEFDSDRLWLNGKEESITNPRLQNVLQKIRSLASERAQTDEEKAVLDAHVHIVSVNNFPTAAGLASSASGYACMVYTLAQVYGVTDYELSKIARVGSGSACRSMYGGWVAWNMGTRDDGDDSFAEQTHLADHWPGMKILILVVSDRKKGTSSTSGMGTSVRTSELLQHRITEVVPKRMAAIKEAIEARDFAQFGEITMRDSNQFHAVCLDTYPPIFYMNDTSKAVVQMVTQYNTMKGEVKAAYTFDAGPNAVIYAMEDAMAEIASLTSHFFPSTTPDTFFRGTTTAPPAPSAELLSHFTIAQQPEDSLQYGINTQPGPGPQVLTDEECLLDSSGLPKATSA
ncbi:diphosphomevalonate decarboxylase [Sphaeroforma arctica JP610]|uniref:Diphosphomevalonate decarboxylase n=1 Tax=Sphaeroforma arctica JP610 TaxID=667725 RepID=A0A0L0GB48_9EUKA|nr:diphosphomevalonate decarboxylase [Sphaeroforma arctica JP610]KNC85488.1 diphosphomevalonate decarboxylase [Sphaeroforma arctica JP610]|eukprot:XP_014159390.1 diphosphomevalonate decarboxylase [Sphaeroforma arctica JP610]